MAHETPSTFGEIEALHDRFVDSLTSPAVWALLMRSAGAHWKRGPLNLMMITAQRPGASDIRTRSDWEARGHQVLPGASAIRIFTLPSGTVIEDGTPWYPDALPMVDQHRLREYQTSIRDLSVVEVFDVSQTSAADDAEYREWSQRWANRPLPIEFVERRSVSELEMFDILAETSDQPDEVSALARLQELARAWVQEDAPLPEGHEAIALSAAHVVARLAGMSNLGPAPVPQMPTEIIPGINSARIKVAATYAIRTGHDIYHRITELCPCCGELADQCIREDIQQ
jgi:hypothetical protein